VDYVHLCGGSSTWQRGRIIAWGGSTADDRQTGLGSTRRVWFHDLSAGPESWTSNFDVDHPDLNDDDEIDYRMPPIWEYTARGFRAPAALTRDLSLITRYVALNLLMTTSPLYPVELPTAGPPKSINVDSNTYQGWPGVNAAAKFIKPKVVVQKLSALRWCNQLAAAKGAGVDPAGAAAAMRAEADAARKTVDLHRPHEFIDTLAPDGPRGQP
jgi:hypothetical protein